MGNSTSTGVILQRGDNAMVKMAVTRNHRDFIQTRGVAPRAA